MIFFLIFLEPQYDKALDEGIPESTDMLCL